MSVATKKYAKNLSELLNCFDNACELQGLFIKCRIQSIVFIL